MGTPLPNRLRFVRPDAIGILVLTIALLVTSIFVLVLPAIEREIVREQREKIKALTDTVWSTIAHFHEQELKGTLSEADAQRQAKEFARHIRYGSRDRDYFVITDLTPRFIMHPLLPHLEGVDLSDYPTIAGRTLGDMARLVERDGAGYLEYMWPSPDDSTQMVPKTAYVREFKPWGWVVGTTIYRDEVERSLMHARTRVLGAGLVVLALMTGLTVVSVRRQRMTELQRDAARSGLAESERKYESVFENATEAIFQSTPEGRLITANPAFARIFGYESPEDALARVTDIALQCYAEPVKREEFRRRIEGDGVVQYFEFEGKRADGSLLHVMMNAHVVRDNHGRTQYYEGIIQDITDLKNTREELQRLNAELESRVKERTAALSRATEELQNVSSVILRWDPEGRVLYMNQYGLDLFKYEAHELVGRSVIETIVPQRDRAGIDLHAMIDNLLRYPERYAQNENENICKDGTRLWMAWMNKPIYDDAGGLKEILTVGIDISRRKHAEEELEDARQSLEIALREQQAFIESISDVFYVCDEEFRLVRWNRRLEDVTACTSDELRGKHLAQLLVPEDIASSQEHLSKLNRSDDVRFEARVLSRYGRRVPHEFRTRRVLGDDEENRYYVGIAHDLKDRLAAQARLVESETMRALGGLVAGFLHELNTPVGALLGSLSVVSRGIDRLSRVLDIDAVGGEAAKVQQVIADSESTARDAADRISTILRGLGSFVNLDRPDAQPFDVQQGIEIVLQLLDPASLKIEVVRRYGDVGRIRCFPAQVNQMFMHLISNALDAMRGGGKLILETRLSEGWLHIRISDTGRGIPEERLQHIFEPQLTHKTNRVGTGLGLFTCYHIVENHGGRIKVDSKVGTGTTVSIDLPAGEIFEARTG